MNEIEAEPYHLGLLRKALENAVKKTGGVSARAIREALALVAYIEADHLPSPDIWIFSYSVIGLYWNVNDHSAEALIDAGQGVRVAVWEAGKCETRWDWNTPYRQAKPIRKAMGHVFKSFGVAVEAMP